MDILSTVLLVLGIIHGSFAPPLPPQFCQTLVDQGCDLKDPGTCSENCGLGSAMMTYSCGGTDQLCLGRCTHGPCSSYTDCSEWSIDSNTEPEAAGPCDEDQGIGEMWLMFPNPSGAGGDCYTQVPCCCQKWQGIGGGDDIPTQNCVSVQSDYMTDRIGIFGCAYLGLPWIPIP